MPSYHQTTRKITLIILHCTATRVNQEVTIQDIEHWHLKRGFQSIGYHFIVDREGTIHQGRPIEKVGAHCKNHNQHSIGICYIGGLDPKGQPSDTRTLAQKRSLRQLLEQLHRDYPKAIICGHRDMSPDLNHDGKITANEYTKLCPCFNAITEYADLQPENY